MARTINSPGVQITETDLSLNQQFGGGTNVFVAGFASQGPTDEIIQVSTASELEQIFGIPQTEAERYFYHSSKEILNSSANLLVTRLPYGSGSGEGFGEQYSALFYPVASGDSGFTIGKPTVKSLTQDQYDGLAQGDFTWQSITGGNQSPTVTEYPGTSSITVTLETSAAALTAVQAIDPSYGIQYNDVDNDNNIDSVTFTFDVTLSSYFYGSGTAQYDSAQKTVNAGIVILNSAQTTVNEAFEGYYVTISDNTGFGADTNFDAVDTFYSLSGNESLYSVSEARLGFALSATKEQLGSGSISETIEFIPTYNLSDTFYKDTLVVSVFKVRNSYYEPQTLTYTLNEAFVGSLDSKKKTVAKFAGNPETFYIEDVINNSSSNIKMLVNPRISKTTQWTNLSSTSPNKAVTVDTNNKAAYPLGTYTPTWDTASNKETGLVVNKLQRALAHIETPETVLVDVVADAGLSTIYSLAAGGAYDEKTSISDEDLINTSTSTYERWRGVFNTFNNFVQNTRKDCVYISDPLRNIFVRGENTKTMSLRTKSFSQNIYTPLRKHFETVDSNYSATYGNWVRAYDAFSGRAFWAPSSGFVAAVYARTDAATQPWFAPAGFNRGTINNILDLAINPNQKQRDFLYTININPIAAFSGDGFVVFGQKTLQSKPSAFDRVNVRRLFLFLERAVQSTVKYFVFEPNTDFTRTRLRNTISPVFDLARSTQGLYDYLIVCDERNNPPDLIDRNELAVDIYIKPTRAAEFILVNFIATRTSQNFQELI